MNERPYTIVSSVGELPEPSRIRDLFADSETISGDRKRGGNNPYGGDRAVGWGITHDGNPMAYYAPLRHSAVGNNLFSEATPNLDIDQFNRWLSDAMKSCRQWTNHNLKFDAHVAWVDGVEPARRMRDTLTLAKLVDQQRRESGYGLKPLGRSWLKIQTEERDDVDAELKRLKTKDFGAVDASIMGRYACSDVHINRDLATFIEGHRYPGDEIVWEMEIALTRALFDIERRGIRVDENRLAELRTKHETLMGEIVDEIARLGYEVDVSKPSKLQDFVFNRLMLPVVAKTKRGRPSVGNDAIAIYLTEPRVLADPKMKRFFELLDVYRHSSQFVSLYANGWPPWITDGVLHSLYNQSVSTGRMSCTNPNMQQLSGEAKLCIVPAPGNGFISRDYSQVEYRMIGVVCNDKRIIRAYSEDRTTDFHQLVADMCGIDRKPAKNVNFGISFSMGEPGLLRQLRRTLGEEATAEQAEKILADYHRQFPLVKRTSNAAKKIAQGRAHFQDGRYGYVKTLYGRRRGLRYNRYRDRPKAHQIDETRLAFNTVIQGTAADIMKEAAVRLEADPIIRDAGVTVRAIVHDEFLFEGPIASIRDRRLVEHIDRVMCSPSINLSVPLLSSGGRSVRNWKAAG